jgi:hypothetical protein
MTHDARCREGALKRGNKTVALSGVGVTTGFTLTPTGLSFGNQLRNTSSAPRVVTLTNTATATLPITSITLGGSKPGQFMQSTSCGASVAVGGSCTINVVFKPTSLGNKSATLIVTPGGGVSAKSVQLTGTGT